MPPSIPREIGSGTTIARVAAAARAVHRWTGLGLALTDAQP